MNVGMAVETKRERTRLKAPAVEIRLLGGVAVRRGGVELPLPASRKVRALLAYLAVAPAPVARSRLCELLWDVPNDPRAELRWSLSKLRGVLDDRQQRRIRTDGDTVALDLTDCRVDAAEVARTMRTGIDRLDLAQLRSLRARFAGDFAEGLELDRNPEFASWLSAQRRQFRLALLAVLDRLGGLLAGTDVDASFEYLEQWLQLAPFDHRAHAALLRGLLRNGRVREGEAHLAATIRQFETEGVNWLPVREAWKAERQRAPDTVSFAQAGSPAPAETVTAARGIDTAGARRASICIMPFADLRSEGAVRGGLADGLTEDIITRLAKLRVLFVIARGSVFALSERGIAADEAGRFLDVDYAANGSVRRHGNRITVAVELVEARTGRIVWADEFTYGLDDALAALDDVCDRIVASIADGIEATERNRAILKPPGSLDAWEAYHRGLWHMYRFNDDDNARAAHCFRMALRQDRTFARAHAGLSFTHFQNAFLLRATDRDKEIERAYAAAAESLIADDRDPAAHWAMGRALWLRGAQEQSLQELEESLSLSPNFALGHYTLGFVHSQAGDARVAIASTDHSRHLSPFDPLQFAMLATRAIALFRLGQHDAAADWATKAAARPNAHAHILAVAANCAAAAGRFDQARAFVATLHKTMPDYRLDDFLGSFRFSADAAVLFRENGARIGLHARR